MTSPLDDLKRLAEAATKGPWFYDHGNWQLESRSKEQFRHGICSMANSARDTCEYGEYNSVCYLDDAKYLEAVSPDKILALIASHEQLQSKFSEAVEVIKIIDINFNKITKCPDNTCDGCHEDAKIAAEYSSKFLRSLDKEKE